MPTRFASCARSTDPCHNRPKNALGRNSGHGRQNRLGSPSTFTAFTRQARSATAPIARSPNWALKPAPEESAHRTGLANGALSSRLPAGQTMASAACEFRGRVSQESRGGHRAVPCHRSVEGSIQDEPRRKSWASLPLPCVIYRFCYVVGIRSRPAMLPGVCQSEWLKLRCRCPDAR